jgi:hypothetical protein
VALLPAAMAWAGPDEDQLKAAGAEALKPFKQQLMSALVKGLKGGPVSALEVCKDQAPKLAGEAGTDSVTIGRTSHRLRNPANAPEPWMEPLLEKYAGDPEMTAPTLVALPAGGYGYVEPITVRAACLECHGVTLDPAVEQKIDELYPADRASGFKEGDFRGLFWVKIAPEK